MLVSKYDAFVRETDWSASRPSADRLGIAIYGLSAEIGSVVAAIKKRLLAEGGTERWDVPNREIEEELGDVVWYCFSLAQIANEKPTNILLHDIANLKQEIGANDDRAQRLKGVLGEARRGEFLAAAANFPTKTARMHFEDYQKLAFLTARTEDKTLVEVCLAVLWQLSAELFRHRLPQSERDLNKSVLDRPINDILGEIAWHVSALASLYNLSLSEVAQTNIQKVSSRRGRSCPTPLHDESYPEGEQFPRRFEIAFVSFSANRCRMYLQGKRIGDELTDNAHEEDGYRFHDIMHIANAAKLGWSPVLRKLMGRKRRSDSKVDEVEDGARAQIVEELVIKAIHSEGRQQLLSRGEGVGSQPQLLFGKPSDITFRFLRFLRDIVVGHEVSKNTYREWEDAIREGHDIFYKLRCEGQGTVSVDLDKRTIAFSPDVCIEIDGKVAGLGSACVASEDVARFSAPIEADQNLRLAPHAGEQSLRVAAQKLAVLDALGIREPTQADLSALTIKEIASKGICVKASGRVQAAIWMRKVVSFKTTTAGVGGSGVHCTAIALADA